MIAYKGWAIPEGNVVKVADSAGRVIWAVQDESEPVVLQVAKITADTRANGTTYAGEQFVSLNIYPTTNGTVSVTYGNLTKTITDTSGVKNPNAQKVFFGTFNGVTDSVATPASGTLTIEGDYYAFGIGTYEVEGATSSKTTTKYCSCITAVDNLGSPTEIPSYAFYECSSLVSVPFVESITSIGNYAFNGCASLVISSLPSGITSIGNYAFNGCAEVSIAEISEGVTSIGDRAFYYAYGDTPNGELIPFKVEHMYLPSTLQSLGDSAISINCKHPNSSSSGDYITLKTLTINATTPPSVSDTQFLGFVYYNGTDNVGGITFIIIVPQGCGATYKAATGWSFYANYIVEAS